MPLKLDIGLSRKIGEPNYGSRGASVNLAVELDSGIVQEPDRLQARIRQLFGMVRDSVDHELQNGSAHHAGGNGHVHGSQGDTPPPATAAQVRALHAIAKRQRIDLKQHLHQFGVSQPEDLTLRQASELIDQLNSQRSGAGGSR